MFIVIDEFHSFIGDERGVHLSSLLSRIQRIATRQPQIAGLSATLGSPADALKWMLGSSADNTAILTDESSQRELRIQIRTYIVPNGSLDEDEEKGKSDPNREKFGDDLFQLYYGKTALVFGNSRQIVEYCADQAKQRCLREKRPDRFLVHHGSLSKSEREFTEVALKSDTPTTTFCSATLEMGIDVGSVSEVGQIDPPTSVHSLVQRMGRSGREAGEPAILRLFTLEQNRTSEHSLFAQLHPKLIQAIAMVELLLEKWCEPPETFKLHLSTLVQQILSLIVERGGVPPEELFRVLISGGAFFNISEQNIRAVLRDMAENDLVEQTREGDLILGLEGERVANHYTFYAVFESPKEYRVVHERREIGTISSMTGLDARRYLILAGRRWKIDMVDEEHLEIGVSPAKGAKLPTFSGGAKADIHPTIRRKMKYVLTSDTEFTYLDDESQSLLARARAITQESNLNERVFFSNGNEILWFTWTGSRINRTLVALAQYVGNFDADDEGIGILFRGTTAGEIVDFYLNLLEDPINPVDLAAQCPAKATEKYDSYLSEEILCEVYARNSFDMESAFHLISMNFDRGTERTA